MDFKELKNRHQALKNIVKQAYKDCKLNMKSLNTALSQLKHI